MFRRVTLLTILVAVIALIPLAIFGLFAIQTTSDHLIQRTLEELRQDVRADADTLKRLFDTAWGDLAILRQLTTRKLARAHAAASEAERSRWYDAIGQAFLTVSDDRRVYNQIRYLDAHGREVVRVDYDGIHPPQLVPRERLQDKRQRPYFTETMTLGPGQVYISPVNRNQEYGRIEVPYRPVIRCATPLFDDSGRRRGIVIINLLIGPFLDALYQEGKAAQKEVYVVDQEGFYLLHDDPAKQWGGLHDLNTGERIQRDFPDLASQLLSSQAIATVIGERVITAQPLALGASRAAPSLVIVELMPTRVALAPVADLRLYLLILLVGVVTVAVGGAVLMGETLSHPLVTLVQATHRIRSGELDVKVKVGGSHEIIELGEAFNAMTDYLAQARRQIDRHLFKLNTVNQIGAAAGSALSLDRVIDQALDTTLQSFGVEAGEIFLFNEERTEVILAGYRGPIREAFQEISSFRLEEGFPGLAAFLDEIVFTSDLPNDPRFLRRGVIDAGFKTFAAIPLKATGKVIGVLTVATRIDRAFTEEDLSILTTIGATIGMAVANAHLFEAHCEGTRQLAEKVEELDSKIEELEWMQSRLVEAERLRTMGQVSAEIAHDFNNALIAVLGQAQLIRLSLERGPVADAIRHMEGYVTLLERLARQEQAALDAAETVRKIREAARPYGEEPFVPVSLNEVVAQVLETTRPRWKDQAEAQALRITVVQEGGPAPSVPAQPTRLPSRLRLLVIDDEPLPGEMLADLLRLLGHEAVVATSGEAGFARLQAEHFDLVMTDLGMPGMSGRDVARTVKARWHQLPVILVSGGGSTMERDQLEEARVDAVLAKPYTLTQLKDALSQAVESTQRDTGSNHSFEA